MWRTRVHAIEERARSKETRGIYTWRTHTSGFAKDWTRRKYCICLSCSSWLNIYISKSVTNTTVLLKMSFVAVNSLRWGRSALWAQLSVTIMNWQQWARDNEERLMSERGRKPGTVDPAGSAAALVWRLRVNECVIIIRVSSRARRNNSAILIVSVVLHCTDKDYTNM